MSDLNAQLRAITSAYAASVRRPQGSMLCTCGGVLTWWRERGRLVVRCTRLCVRFRGGKDRQG